MAQVTVQGGNVSIAAAATGQDALSLQNQIALTIINPQASAAGAHLDTATLSGGGAAPNPVAGTAYAEAYINDTGGQSYTVSSSYHAVLYNPTGADTVYLNPGQDVVSGTVGGVFVGIGGDTLALGGGNNYFSSAPFQSGSFHAASNPDYVVAGAGNDSLFGSNGGTLDGGAGSNVLWAGGDTVGTTFISSGTDLIVGGGGTDSASVSGSHSTLFGGSGVMNVSVSGVGDTLAGMGATALNVTLAGSAAVVFGGTASGTFSVVDHGTADTIAGQSATTNVTLGGASGVFAGGSGVATVSAGTGTAVALGGTGSLTFLGGAGNATVVGAQGATTSVSGGSGSLLFAARSGNATVSGGAGAVTMFGGSGGNVTFTDTSHAGLLYLAGAGNETLDASGSNGNNSLFGNTIPGASLLIKAGSGNDTILGGPGNDTLVAGSGKDLFAFFNGNAGGQDVISGLTSSDTVALAGYNLQSLVSSLQNAVVTSGGVKITLSDNTSITFSGLNSLNGQNII